jgi:diguanylate cyclase (GGDEF)-like protein
MPSRWEPKNVGGVLLLAAAALVSVVTALSVRYGQLFQPRTRALNYELSGVAAVIGLLLLCARAERVPRWLLNTLPSVAAVLVCIPSSLDRSPGPLGPLLLTWPVAFAAAVLSPRTAWVTTAVTALAFAVLSSFSNGSDGVVRWIEVTASNSVICWMVVGLQQQSLRLRETLAALARTDSLTGVANRRGFDEALEREHARMLRGASPMSLLLLDIDHFKVVNDSWGHQAGDDTLRRLGALLLRRYRAVDAVGRVGGEEFAVLLPQCAADDARVRGVELCEAVRSVTASWPHPITVSVGVATISGSGTGPDELAGAADAALYRAKEAGRDRVEQAPERAAGD